MASCTDPSPQSQGALNRWIWREREPTKVVFFPEHWCHQLCVCSWHGLLVSMLLNPSKGKPTAIPTVKARQQSADVVGSLPIRMPLLDAICYLDITNTDLHAETQFIPDSTLAVHSPVSPWANSGFWLFWLTLLSTQKPCCLDRKMNKYTAPLWAQPSFILLFFFFRNVQNIRFHFHICFSLYFAHTEPTLLVTPYPLFPSLLSQIILLLGSWRPQASHRDPFKMFHC